MRIAEYKRVGTDYAERQEYVPPVVTDGENGEVIEAEGYYRTVTDEIPIYDTVYRDATPEEEAVILAEQEEHERIEAEREPTDAERNRADIDFLMVMGGYV